MTVAEPAGSVDLLRQVARGEREAFAGLYDRHASLVLAFATRLLGARSDAEDLLQEVFLQVWRQAGDYDPSRGSPEAWLLTITRSRGIDKLRSRRRRGESERPADEAGPAEGEGGVVQSGESQAEARLTVATALGELPEPQRRVLELAYLDGLTQTEIAERLREPLGTVKTRMRTALERLRGLAGRLGAPAGGAR